MSKISSDVGEILGNCKMMAMAAVICVLLVQVVVGAILPHFLERIQEDTKKAGGTASALKHELHILTTLTIEMRALANCCDSLGRYG